MERPPFPIDFVYRYTWRGYFPEDKTKRIEEVGRNRDNDELHYSLRALYENCKWFRHVYITIADHSEPPKWINRQLIVKNKEAII